MSNTFHRELRILTAAQFDKIFQKSQRFSTNCCRVLYCSNDCGHPRLGVIVSKKNVSKAKDRNRFKRRVRESFRLMQHELNDIDVVVLANRVVNNASNEELWACLRVLWQKLIVPQGRS